MASELSTAAPTPAKEKAGSAVDLAEVERAVGELLRNYRIALQYASDMPLLGRSKMSQGPSRWGSRVYARAYIETHVRKQLRAIRDCLRLRRLGAAGPEEAQRLSSLEEELERYAEPLFRWRRLVGLLARLPVVAAAVPVLSAVSAWPLADDISFDEALDALLVLAGTALFVWIVVVWPSIRLGFRVKRAIFAGGRDLHHPLMGHYNRIDWLGFRAPRFYDDEVDRGRMLFPQINVYHAENNVFRALERRKPGEIPVDMLLGIAPYLVWAYFVFYFYWLIDTLLTTNLLDIAWGGVLFGAIWLILPVGFVVVGGKSYRTRRH